jgi:hypothetical protein
MQINKLAVVLASLATAAAMTAVLDAAPAQAATASKATLDLSGDTRVQGTYGDFVGIFGGGVTYIEADATTTTVNDGIAKLERRLPGGSWGVVRTDDSAGFLYFGSYGSHARGSARYRVHYLGGTGTDAGGNPITWDPTYSNVVTVGTFWNLNDYGHCTPGCHLHGRLAPKSTHHRVVIQAKHGVWKRYKVVHTDSRSRFRAYVTPTGGNGTKYRIVVAATPKLLQTTSGVYIARILGTQAAHEPGQYARRHISLVSDPSRTPPATDIR